MPTSPGPSALDLVLIGAGQANVPLAHALAGKGWRVALVERHRLGGSCVNFGCTPTKAALASARVAESARRAAEFGVNVPEVAIDFPAVLARARAVATESREGLERGFTKTDNPRLVRGHARLDGRDGDAFRIRVGDETLLARQVVLDTGTRTKIPSIEGLDQGPFLDSGNWMDRPDLPEHLAIVGGGYIGVEMAQFYRRMGSRVTVVEPSGHILSHEDEEVSQAMQDVLAAEGVSFRFHTKVEQVTRDGSSLRLRARQDQRLVDLDATHLFVATGRRPNTDDLGLETVGVKLSDKGIVEADERLATSVPGIWVAGDIRGGPMFTHTSWDDYRVLLSQLAGDGQRTTQRIVPYAVFTEPELGRVGLTEREAREQGRAVRTSRFDLVKNGRAREEGATTGFIKLVGAADSDEILGAAVFAAHGGELVHLFVMLMNANAPFTTLRDAVCIHPTLAEAVQSATERLR